MQSNKYLLNRLHALILSVIFILALCVRVYPIVNDPENHRAGFGIFGDSFLYHKIGYNLYKGRGFSGKDDGEAFGQKEPGGTALVYTPELVRPPLYPLFIAGVYRFFGNKEAMLHPDRWRVNLDRVRLAQCVIDSLTCLVVFFIVYEISEGACFASLLGALIYSVSPYNIFYTRALLSETLAVFFVTSTIWFWIRAIKSPTTAAWLFTGALLGLAVLTRPEHIFFILVICALSAVFNLKDPLMCFKRGALVLLGFLLISAPWISRNYRLFHRPVVASSSLGFNLFQGTYESNANWSGWGQFPKEAFESEDEKNKILDFYERYDQAMTEGDPDIQIVDKDFTKIAVKRIQENPLKMIKLWIEKIPRLWYQKYIPMYAYRESSGIYLLFYLAFAVFGFLTSSLQQKRAQLPIACLFIYLTIIYLPLHIEPRYCVAAIPGIIALSAVGISNFKMVLERYRLPMGQVKLR